MSLTAGRYNPGGLLLLLWGVLSLAGFGQFLNYATTSGDPGSQRGCWPDESHIARNFSTPTLLMFLHPHCPCSAASLDELAQVVTRCPEGVAIYVLFCRPERCPPEWEKTAIWEQAKKIPRVSVRLDLSGAEARRFGVNTSGHVLLFDTSGRLRFSGGITRARGHRGENAGQDAVVSWITEKSSGLSETPVFGCPLHD